jgi:hypothetical protein
MSGTTSTTKSFRVDNSKESDMASDKTDSPDVFIDKMKRTMDKKKNKKKNNYKDIEILENIYESVHGHSMYEVDEEVDEEDDDENEDDHRENVNPKLTESLNNTFSSISSGLDKFQNGLDNFANAWNKLVGAKTEPEKKKTPNGKKNTTSVSEKGGEQSTPKKGEEGFSNSSSSTKKNSNETVYTPEYEFDDSDTNELLEKIKNGKLSITELKNLLNTGLITQKQYNDLFGWSLNNMGIDWKNVVPKKSDPPKCGPFEKNCGKDSQSIVEYIKQFLDYIKQFFDLYTKILTYIATTIYKITDGQMNSTPSNSKSDVDLIVKIMHYLILIPISIWFAYNWFYVTLYRDETGKQINIEFSSIVIKSLKGLLKRFFKCLVQPMIIFDAILRKFLPKMYFKAVNIIKFTTSIAFDISFIGKILSNPIFMFIGLTFLILLLSCKYSGKIFDFLYSYIADKKVPYEGYLHGIIAYDWIIGIQSIGIFGTIVHTIETVMSPFSSFFWFLVLVIFSHLAIRFGGLFIILYLYIMSGFALAMFSPGGVMAGIKSIKLAMEESIADDKSRNCPKGWWEKIILGLLNSIYKSLNIVLYIIVLIYSIIKIFTTMSSSSSKIILGTLLSIITTMLGLIIVFKAIANNRAGGITKSDIDI